MRLQGRNVVIAGGSGALGRALAARLVAEGASGLLIGDIDGESAAALARELSANGSTTVLSQRVDVTDLDSVEALVARATTAFGGIDVVINNAGILTPPARVHRIDSDDFRRILDVNLMGTFHGMRAAIPVMRARGGSIINTASVGALRSFPYASAYCASKAAVVQMSVVAAEEYAEEKIRVNCVCPGVFMSGIHDTTPAEAIEAMTAKHAMKRFAEADEMTGAFIYLASDDSTFVTGTTLVVDGGYSC
jgi:NAD(P)-dependent dehydrogenase (short-subunit alcohol dehydrogenase family)